MKERFWYTCEYARKSKEVQNVNIDNSENDAKRTIIWKFGSASFNFEVSQLLNFIAEQIQLYFYYCLSLANTFSNIKWKPQTLNQLTHLDVIHAKYINQVH